MNGTITDLMQTLVADLAAEGVPHPAAHPFTLAVLWADLCRLAGEEPPAEVLALLDEDVVEQVVG